ncbi:MAG: SurA N-terminal domain-containing protein [Halanaerobiales bacterium]|nr:SurA N-terminal domain-containing protein [Halanaerobiales bacterium]
MFSKIRNYSKIIIIIIVVAMAVTGFVGYGTYLTNRPTGTDAGSPYIARVNRTNITRDDYNALLRNRAAGIQQMIASQIVPFKLNVLNSIIEKEVILQEADRMGLKPQVTDQDVQDYIAQVLAANEMTEEELSANLQTQGITLAQLTADLKKGMEEENLIEQARDSSFSNINVTEEEIINEYEKIDLKVIKKDQVAEADQAEQSINEALNQLKAGTEFSEVAGQFSDLNTSGELGLIGRNNPYLPGEIVAQAFELETGRLSEVISAGDAYYILKVVDKQLAEGEEYENAREDIKERLLTAKQNEAFHNWLANLKAEAGIVINDPLLKGYNILTQGNYGEAEKELTKALDIYPALTYIYLAEAYQGNDKIAEATTLFEQTVAAAPENWEVYYHYGNFLAGLEGEQKALSVAKFDQAAELAGENFTAHYLLYIGYSQLGEEEKAQQTMALLQEISQRQLAEEEATQPETEQAEETTADAE